jgi:hypothetical protein
MYFRWTEIDDRSRDENIPRAEVPSWPECAPSHYKLQQWWHGDQTYDGEWRDIFSGNGSELPEWLIDI